MTTRIRHVEFVASTLPETWPAEAIEALLDRGTFDAWQRLAEEIHRSPWGRVARIVETITTWGELGSVDHLMRSVIEAARLASLDSAPSRPSRWEVRWEMAEVIWRRSPRQRHPHSSGSAE
jgi:hypothetical protein